VRCPPLRHERTVPDGNPVICNSNIIVLEGLGQSFISLSNLIK
jgi:hypothetical protein